MAWQKINECIFGSADRNNISFCHAIIIWNCIIYFVSTAYLPHDKVRNPSVGLCFGDAPSQNNAWDMLDTTFLWMADNLYKGIHPSDQFIGTFFDCLLHAMSYVRHWNSVHRIGIIPKEYKVWKFFNYFMWPPFMHSSIHWLTNNY